MKSAISCSCISSSTARLADKCHKGNTKMGFNGAMKYVCLLVLILLATSPVQAQRGPGGGDAPPTQVFAAQVQQRTIADKVEALGTLRADETVTLTSNVTDTVTAIRFDDGQRVSAGDVLIEMANEEESALLK